MKPDRQLPDGCGLGLVLLLTAAMLVGCVTGRAMGDEPHHTPPPGFDICTTRGC